jgi:T5SS/PEP-CTERM-associated repeat protein
MCVLSLVPSAQALTVGNSTPNNVLTLSSGIHEHGNVEVGWNVTSSNNTLSVVGTNTFLSSSSWLIVGVYGSANNLVISNGGRVENSGNGWIARTTNSSNNTVLVTDPGSTWKSALLDVGRLGPGNRLIISNGGMVICQWSYISQDPNSSNNTVIVTDPGSIWTNSRTLNIGNQDAGNSLIISNGGTVVAFEGCLIGLRTTSSNNLLLITGTGSRLNNNIPSGVVVGYGAPSNRLIISNGGAVDGTGSVIVGAQTNSSNNFVHVSGVGSSINAGGVTVGSREPGNSLIIDEGAAVRTQSGSIGTSAFSSNNIVTVSGEGSIWSNSSTFSVGVGSGNAVAISNGGTLVSSNGWISSAAGSSNNAVLVFGNGSIWTNVSKVTVGGAGSGTLTIANGGIVAAPAGITIASSNTSTSALNIGSYGGTDTAGSIFASAVTFGSGKGAINFNQENSYTVSSTISGDGSINQLGSGITILTSINGFTGAINLAKGRLVVTGPDATTQFRSISISNGAVMDVKLSRDDAFTGNLALFEDLIASTGSVLSFEIRNATAYSSISAANAVINGRVVVTLDSSYIAQIGDSFAFVSVSGAVSGSPNLGLPSLGNGLGWWTNDFANSGVLWVTNFSSSYTSWLTNYPALGVYTNMTDDPDGDGFSNSEEYALGTDPSDWRSSFRALAQTATSGGVEISWDAVAGKSYQVVVSTNLASDSWQSVGKPVFTSVNERLSQTYSMSTGQQFYRVILLR